MSLIPRSGGELCEVRQLEEAALEADDVPVHGHAAVAVGVKEVCLLVIQPWGTRHHRTLAGAVVQEDVTDVDEVAGRYLVAVGKDLRAVGRRHAQSPRGCRSAGGPIEWLEDARQQPAPAAARHPGGEIAPALCACLLALLPPPTQLVEGTRETALQVTWTGSPVCDHVVHLRFQRIQVQHQSLTDSSCHHRRRRCATGPANGAADPPGRRRGAPRRRGRPPRSPRSRRLPGHSHPAGWSRP